MTFKKMIPIFVSLLCALLLFLIMNPETYKMTDKIKRHKIYFSEPQENELRRYSMRHYKVYTGKVKHYYTKGDQTVAELKYNDKVNFLLVDNHFKSTYAINDRVYFVADEHRKKTNLLRDSSHTYLYGTKMMFYGNDKDTVINKVKKYQQTLKIKQKES
ncbi:hypothetical protein J9174_05290 [Macrococcoides canis]|uniref:hypothetical protein n=1 Tax=Macrococcoides canis TaxID=1855823 RepID=UPI001AEC161E|nr:hypothetical protein [Macrococcus canis]QTQ09087.1 hypothetical protein J9174_05290 [Macrococcus canis]